MNISIFRKSIVMIITTALLATMLVMVPGEGSFAATEEVRGVWIAFNEFEDLGLKNASKKKFKANFEKILDKAEYYGCNTVFFHVRVCDDAVWKSKTFSACKFMTSNYSAYKTAAQTYTYDPLKVACQVARQKGFQIHAWMNPYRMEQYHRRYLNPASTNSTKRINKAINELKAYDLDGVHFDDFFYHSKGYYLTPTKATRYSSAVSGTKTYYKPDSATRRNNVNKMIKSVYKNVHKKSGWVFGISPAGNVDNCMSAGADVKTWMSKKGYVDYVAPQIYWSDKYGYYGNVTMYTDRLEQWTGLNKRKLDFYAGLALYRAGVGASGDYGWKKSNTNIRDQIKLMRKYGGDGYILFKTSDFYRSGAAKELKNLKALVAPVYPTKVEPTTKKITLKVKKTKTIKLEYSPEDVTYKKVTYSSADKTIATVTSKGKIKAKKKGTTTITIRAKKGGALATVTVTVK